MPPESNPCDEHRSDEATENSAGPETTIAERVTHYGSERAANPTERAGNEE